MDACFISQDKLFINIFQNKKQEMTTLIYNILDDKIEGTPVKTMLPSTSEKSLNFPNGTFFDKKRKFVHIFFRMGESFTMNLKNPSEVFRQNLDKPYFESVNLYKNDVLIIKVQSDFEFFRLVKNEQDCDSGAEDSEKEGGPCKHEI